MTTGRETTSAPAGLGIQDGRVVRLADVRVPALDRGFLFGEAAYEVCYARNGRCFALEAHLDRLARSLEGIALSAGGAVGGVRSAIDALLRAAPPADALVYVQVTGGVGDRVHVPPRAPEPGVYGFWYPFHVAGLRRERASGIALRTMPDPRWRHSDLKTTQLLGSVLGKRHAAGAEAQEVLFTEDGLLVEGGSSNVFVVLGDEIVTPPRTRNLLPGITRDVLLEGHPREMTERDVPVAALEHAAEVFVTSTSRPLVPVVGIDGRRIGTGEPGPIAHRLAAWLGERMDRELGG